jgi:hypothetical protein
MGPMIAGLSVFTAAAIALGSGIVWNRYLREPQQHLEPMPAHLVVLDSPAGRALLAGSDAVADFDKLRAHFVPQSRRAYCGVASALTTLNAGGARLDEAALFSHPNVDSHPLKVSFTGMSLRQLGTLMRAHGARVDIVHASDANLDDFRRVVRQNLAREGDFLILNYERELLGQPPMGHISPVAAYHADSDRLLVLDVAAHRYPPTWVPLEGMWNAMRAPLNASTTRTRGFLAVHDNSPYHSE